ncbi:hypothetical protein DACRYDRAFT_92666 [Dacryopinax primogenitus]|uniref:C2H2-type domain-containing protein n=1 Tax=Dacryopinax primogenitus (strain DJM 731) TaxID=1858805 RepID=M5G4U8_DACPD|nr:uncharacterized protein DACRYDRAFT_92666 [Dacryopinax primogenitus]EJU05286.1 hypothetical protein DACRYDRAFT_92666 [Dacryopinax primogenitus]
MCAPGDPATKYECRLCGSNYSRLEYLKRHERKHQDIRPFKCPKCAKEFARSDVLLRHRRRQHPDDPTLPPVQTHNTSGTGTPPVPSPTSPTAPRRRRRATTNGSSSSNSRVSPPLPPLGVNTQVQPVTSQSSGVTASSGPTLSPDLPSPLEGILHSNSFPLVPPFQLSSPAAAIASGSISPEVLQHIWPEAFSANGLRYGTGASGEYEQDEYGFRTTTNANRYVSSAQSWADAAGFGQGAGNAIAAAAAMGSAQSTSSHSPGSTNLFPSPSLLSDPALATSPPTSVSISPPPGTSPNDGAGVPLEAVLSGGYEDVCMSDVELSAGEASDHDPLAGTGELPLQHQQEQIAQAQAAVNAQAAAAHSAPSPDTQQAAVAAYLQGTSSRDRDAFLAEQTMLKIDGSRMELIRGVCNRDPTDRFYVPPGFFAYCYQVPRWKLPRLSILCSLASRSLNGMLVHLPFVHEPTFRLASLPGPLAFAICSVGGVGGVMSVRPHKPDFNEVASWGQEIMPQVRIEKADMLVRNFHKQKRGMTRLEMLAVVQALMLYNAPSLMSGDDCDRLVGHLFLGTIVTIARQAGLFVATAEHASNAAYSCEHITWLLEPGNDAALERKWKDWILSETYRRAAFLVYILDTLSSLESSIPAIVHPNHVAHIPLPAPDLLWQAQSAREWGVGMTVHHSAQGVSLDQAMKDVLRPVASHSPLGDESAGTSAADDAKFTEMGPFARIIVILTLVRGLMTLGEGEKAGGPVTKRWALEGMTSGKWWNEPEVLEAYQSALQRWKKRWSADRLCPHPFTTATARYSDLPEGLDLDEPLPSPLDPRPAPPHRSSSNSTATPTTPGGGATGTTLSNLSSNQSPQYALVNHASPYYWFAQMLISIIRAHIAAQDPASVGANVDDEQDDQATAGMRNDDQAVPNRFVGTDLRRMLFVAREYGMQHAP